MSHRTDVHGVEMGRNRRVDQSLIALCDAFRNYRLHLLGGDSAQRSQGWSAVQNHYIDLPDVDETCEGRSGGEI